MKSTNKPIVSVVRNENISLAVNECLNQLKIPNLSGKSILLKPNVGREIDPKLGINTNPEVVEAVFRYLKEKFNANYFIGDSPIINTDTRKAFVQSGYSRLLDNNGIQFLDLDSKAPIELDIPNGKILKKIKVTGYWNDFDYIISIPVLKMHMHCGASLSFKNLKGVIYKRDKINLHHFQVPEIVEPLKKSMAKVKELDVAISDIAYVLRSDLSIIDASFAQEGMGPSSGNTVKLDTIIASTNFLAADIIALAITQPKWTLEDVPHLKLASEIIPNAPKCRKDILTVPKNIKKFLRPLEPPPKSISIKYKNVNLIDVDSCSACLSTIFNLLKNNKEFIDQYFTDQKPLNLVIGKGVKESELYEDTYLIGNCTYNLAERGTFIKGCTPVESKILEIIKKNLKLI